MIREVLTDTIEQLAALAALAMFTFSIALWASYLCEVAP